MENFTATFQRIKTAVDQGDNIVITTHKSPDGDALGSMLGLKAVLEAQGKTVTAISVNAYADFLNWLPGVETILVNDDDGASVAKAVQQADVIFALDYNALSRVEQVGHLIHHAKGVKVMIDHHLNPEDFADLMVSSSAYGSTAEMVYEWIVDVYGKDAITKDVASCLYTGLVTDTGSFRFPSTRPETHQIAAHLLSTGIKHDEIHNAVYDTYSYARMRLVGYALSEKASYITDLNAVIMVLNAAELAKFNYKKGDTEGLVNMGLSIAGVKFACLISESDSVVKMSFRSKGDMPVNELASKYFNGGGHRNAAGGRSDLSPEQTAKKLEEVLLEYKSFLQ